ncbi:MAG: DNA topoisomerase, partial [archaeon]
AYRLYKLNPSATLTLAQKLYLEGLISYPRTSSQKIPKEIEPKKILKKLEKVFPEAKNITRANPIEGKKSDPAHPSIYPTGEFKQLDGQEEKLYNLIAKRFIACFSSDARTANKRIVLSAIDNKGKQLTYTMTREKKKDIALEGEADEDEKKEEETVSGKEVKINFTANGLEIIDKGWTSFYPIKLEENILPDMSGKVKIDEIKILSKETQPPSRFSSASLVSILEKKNLGTKATRSSIVETLFDRGYLDGKSIAATSLGMQLIAALEKYSPIIIDENLTRQLEDEMEKIQDSKDKNLEAQENLVLDKAKRLITDISKEFKSQESNIGKELLKGIETQRAAEKESNTLMPCPTCKTGNLRIIYSKKTRRQFIACSSYPNCKQTYSLPPNSLIKKVENDKKCEADGFPKLLAIRKGKRPWEFCFNPECPIEKAKKEAWAAKKNDKTNTTESSE